MGLAVETQSAEKPSKQARLHRAWRKLSHWKLQTSIAVIHSGNQVRAFTRIRSDLTYLYVSHLSYISLRKYSVVIVPTFTDQIALAACSSKLQAYVKSGGVLLLLGARESVKPWIPFCAWDEGEREELKIDLPVPCEESRIIFAGLNMSGDLGLHPPRLNDAHGYLEDGSLRGSVLAKSLLNARATSVGTQRVTRCLMMTVKAGRGALLATTLDPDFHTSPQIDPQGARTSRSILVANLLIRNLLDWADRESEKIPRHTRLINRLASYLRPGFFAALGIFLIAAPSGAIAKWIWPQLSGGPWDKVAVVTGLVSSLLSIYEFASGWLLSRIRQAE